MQTRFDRRHYAEKYPLYVSHYPINLILLYYCHTNEAVSVFDNSAFFYIDSTKY